MKKLFSLILALILLTSSFAYAEEASEEWYRERADDLLATLTELSGSEEYLTLFVGIAPLSDQIAAWHEAISQEPEKVERYLMPFDSLIRLVLNATDVELPDSARKYIGRRLGSTLISLFNVKQDSTFLAASSMVQPSEGFIMPEGFEPCVVVYEYDGICVGVTFTQIGEGVVMGNAQICTDDVIMLLPRANQPENTGISSPLLPQTTSSETTDRTTSELRVGRRGK